MLSETQEYIAWAFEYVEDNYDELSRVTGQVMKNSKDERIPDAISFITLHNLPNMLRTWDPSIGEIDTHVLRSWRWYVWKYLKKSDKQREREERFHGGHTAAASYLDHMNLDDREIVDKVIEGLTPHEWMLLRKHYMEGCTISEIADHACLNRGTVISRLNKAMENAKEILAVSSTI